jgi:hypothetical protein
MRRILLLFAAVDCAPNSRFADLSFRHSGAGDVQVGYQVNDQSSVKSQWVAAMDGKTATYKDDAIALLRSLPEAAKLTINVSDGPGPGHEATFQLNGLDAIRKKIAAACKWSAAADKVSSKKH